VAPPSGAPGLVEIEVRDGFRLGGIEGGGLVEVEGGTGLEGRVTSWRRAGGGQRGRGVREPEVAKDAEHGEGVGEEGEDPHFATAVGAAQREGFVDPGEQPRPPGAGCALCGSREPVLHVIRGAASPGRTRFQAAGQGGDALPQTGVRREDAMIPVSVDARWGGQAGERGEKLQGREDEQGAPVRRGARRLVEDVLDVARGSCDCWSGGRRLSPGGAFDPQAFEGEGGPGAVAQESLPPGAVTSGDADRGIDAEAARRLPGEHVEGGGLVEQVAPPEEAEHAAAHPLLKPLDVAGAGLARLVEVDRTIGIFREEAVEDDQVEVEVGVEGRALLGGGRRRRRAGPLRGR
jgi:hypothetical protein